MATRSRLGRDPLQGAAKPNARTTGRKTTKKAAAGAKTAPPPDAAVAAPSPDGRGLPPPETAAPDAAAVPAPPTPPDTPDAADVSDRVAQAPSPAETEPVGAGEAPSPSPDAPVPGSSPLAKSDVPLQGELSLDIFFRGVLEAFLPDDPAALRVDVDSAAFTMPIEKILYFSHVLQRIAHPLARPDHVAPRPGADDGPFPVLSVRLRGQTAGRHTLELFDNGRYFRDRLPRLHLGLEDFRPLLAFVLKQGGSLRMARGRCVAFEITG